MGRCALATLPDVGVIASPHATVLIKPSPSPIPREKYRKAIFRLAKAELVLGTLSILLGASAAIVGSYARDSQSCAGTRFLSHSSQGVWCGLLLVMTGALGIGRRNKPSGGVYIANMTMAVITSAMLGVGFILSIVAVLTSVTWCGTAISVIHVCVTIACFSSMVITIMHAAYCCGGICCGGSADAGFPYASNGQLQITHGMQHQYVYRPNGEMMILATTPQAPSGSTRQQSLSLASDDIWNTTEGQINAGAALGCV